MRPKTCRHQSLAERVSQLQRTRAFSQSVHDRQKPEFFARNPPNLQLGSLPEWLCADCCPLAEILDGLSHDSVNRFLVTEKYEPKDLFTELKLHIELIGRTLSGHETVMKKPYSDHNSTEFIGYFGSANQHRPVKSINLIPLYSTDINGKSVPVNYRIYNKRESKTKNDYFREMIAEVLVWGLKPQMEKER